MDLTKVAIYVCVHHHEGRDWLMAKVGHKLCTRMLQLSNSQLQCKCDASHLNSNFGDNKTEFAHISLERKHYLYL